MLETKNLTVTYGSHRALEAVSANVGENEICVVLGSNGAGKSTLLKAIGGIVRANGPTEIIKDGRSLNGLPASQIVEAGVALVPEGRGIFGDLTVAENLELGAYAKRARGREKKNRDMVLELFPKLAERRGQVARTMSGGEQQMVAIGRALMSSPDILMLDEPSLGLSPLLCTELFRTLREIRGTGVGILLVEQNARQSLAIADRGYLLENGHLTGEGTAERLISDPAVQRAYLGSVEQKADIHHEERVSYMVSYSRQADALSSETNTIEALVRRAEQVHAAHIEAKRASSPVPSAFRTAQQKSAGPATGSSIPELVRRADEVMKQYVIERRQARLKAAGKPSGTDAARPTEPAAPAAQAKAEAPPPSAPHEEQRQPAPKANGHAEPQASHEAQQEPRRNIPQRAPVPLPVPEFMRNGSAHGGKSDH